ncbi:unnamed protein product [Vicia faba]|uniref:Uncharacterized protein n=1 Tax=Vicia faba TaxID=3906 RepID=A0AAV1ADZ2_VICFA|nr:unnamed protein product [Vicia faba]
MTIRVIFHIIKFEVFVISGGLQSLSDRFYACNPVFYSRADLEEITAVFTVTLTALIEQMTNLANQVKNNNNMNQRRDMRREHVRLPRGGNNHRVFIAENLSSEEEESYEEEVVDHGKRHNHDYRGNANILLFYETMGMKEFLD